jgi:hypothetical protein
LGEKETRLGKSFYLCIQMKKFCHISLSMLLSVTLLFIGSGVNIMRCAHTGTVKVMTVLNSGGMGNMSCGMNSDCMTMEHVELSPTNMAQAITYDFHVFQPLLAILPSLVAEWFFPTENKATVQFIPEVWKSPPRDYLNLIRVLLI